MDFKREGDVCFVRFDKGEEVLAELYELCVKEDIRTASVTGIGAADRIVAGVYDLERKLYDKREYVGQTEIIALTGSITCDAGKPYLHLHICFAGEDMSCKGGHLNECRISGTCEITLILFGGAVGRKRDAITRLNVFDFD